MSFLKSLPADAVVLDVFRNHPLTSIPLIEYHEQLMRGPSPFSPAQRELIAAFVSGLNACHYCHGVHTATAAAFGIEEQTLASLLDDLETADIDDALRPVLRFARKLTESPSTITAADADAVFAAGWDDQALHDLVSVTALFNFMNRLVEGLGIDAGPDYFRIAGERLEERGYAGLLPLISPQT